MGDALKLGADMGKLLHGHGMGPAAGAGAEGAVFVADVADLHIDPGVHGTSLPFLL